MVDALREKSMSFAIEIVELYKRLSLKREYVLSRQLLKAGTSVGANLREAKNAQSPMDFISKNAIAQKECDETLYWLELLYKTNYISASEYEHLASQADELLRMIRSTILTKKKNLGIQKQPSGIVHPSSFIIK